MDDIITPFCNALGCLLSRFLAQGVVISELLLIGSTLNESSVVSNNFLQTSKSVITIGTCVTFHMT